MCLNNSVNPETHSTCAAHAAADTRRLGKCWPVLSLPAGKHSCAVLAENFSNDLQNAVIVIAIIINMPQQGRKQNRQQQNKQKSRNKSSEDRKKKKRGDHGRQNSKGERRRMELEAAGAGRWSWKQWRQEDRIGSGGGEKNRQRESLV